MSACLEVSARHGASQDCLSSVLHASGRKRSSQTEVAWLASGPGQEAVTDSGPAQPFTPALAPVMSMGQPQFDVGVLVEPAVHFSRSSSLRKALHVGMCVAGVM